MIEFSGENLPAISSRGSLFRDLPRLEAIACRCTRPAGSVSHVFDGIGGTAPSVDALGPQSVQMRLYPGLEVGGLRRTCRTPGDIREGEQPRVEHELHIPFTANEFGPQRCFDSAYVRSEERRVGKECRS